MINLKGFIFEVFQEFIYSKVGSGIWRGVSTELNLPQFIPFESYSDELFQELINSTVKLSGLNRDRLLFDFGRHFVKSSLVQKINIDSFRKVTSREFLLDIMNIHKEVSKSIPGSRPPKLRLEKPAFDELNIEYFSDRRLCMFLKGLIQGTAESFREKIYVTEKACMDNGDPHCLINIKFLSI